LHKGLELAGSVHLHRLAATMAFVRHSSRREGGSDTDSTRAREAALGSGLTWRCSRRTAAGCRRSRGRDRSSWA
jgi:hypothetical protein